MVGGQNEVRYLKFCHGGQWFGAIKEHDNIDKVFYAERFVDHCNGHCYALD